MRHDIVLSPPEVQQQLPETSFKGERRGEGQPGASRSVCRASEKAVVSVVGRTWEKENTHTHIQSL